LSAAQKQQQPSLSAAQQKQQQPSLSAAQQESSCSLLHIRKSGFLITLLGNDLARLERRDEFKQKFHRVFVGLHSIHRLTASLLTTMAPSAVLLLETAKHTPIRDDQRLAFVRKAQELVQPLGWSELTGAPTPDHRSAVLAFTIASNQMGSISTDPS